MSNTPIAPVEVMRRDNVETILPLMPNQLGLLLFGCAGVEPDPNQLPVRAAAPEFTLPSAPDGNPLGLRDLLTRGHLVLVFYRGHW